MELGPVRMPAVDLLDRIAAASTASSSSSKESGAASGAGSFASMLQQSLAQVSASQTQAETAAHQYQLGQNEVSLEDAMISMQKANISFQTTVQVRNKLVTAYNDIMNMQL